MLCGGMVDDDLARALAEVGREVRDAVLSVTVTEADADLVRGGGPHPVELRSRDGADLDRAWVTVARFSPGQKEVIGRFEDALLAGLEVYEDPYLCSGGQLMGLASAADTAVLDPRPLF